MTQCVICRNEATDRPIGSSKHWYHTVECPRCGAFDYDFGAGVKINSPEELVLVSGWVREQNLAGIERPLITRETVARVTGLTRPLLRERAPRDLAELCARSPGGRYVALTWAATARDPELLGRSYSRDEHELRALLRILEDELLIKPEAGDNFSISIKGLLQAEALGSARSNVPQAFVAMNFDESLLEAWTSGFDPAIRAAGFHPFRIDNMSGGSPMRSWQRSGAPVRDRRLHGPEGWSVLRGRVRAGAWVDCHPDLSR